MNWVRKIVQKSDKKTGTKEWADVNINIAKGCVHNCRYCYAAEMAQRFAGSTKIDWSKMTIDNAKVDKKYGKQKGKVMLFSTHDWTEKTLNQGCCVLRKLLDAGNEVLIVSKPHWHIMTMICEAYQDYKEQIMFRFTIGSIKDDVLAFWEPNAPNFSERIGCLQYAFDKGYKTSVSCEPFLDAFVLHTYDACIAYITESFWIGKLNQFKKRVRLDGATKDQISKYVEPLKVCLTDNVLISIYSTMKNKDKVQWKDSMRKLIESKTRQVPKLLYTKKIIKTIKVNL